jgi:hypothetical protein
MKLTRAEIFEGEYYVRNRDLPKFLSWAKSLGIVTLDLDELERTFARQFRKDNVDSALRLFQGYFCKVDREAEYRAWRLGIVKWVIYSLAFGVGMLWMLFKAKG